MCSEIDFWRNVFCSKVGLTASGVLIVTVQKNNRGDCSSRVIDFDNNNFHSHYPVALSKTYSETRFGDLLICFRGGLTSSPLELFKTNSISDQHKAISTDRPPFCCSAMASYKNCSTAHDDLFTDLVNGRGHRSSGFCL